MIGTPRLYQRHCGAATIHPVAARGCRDSGGSRYCATMSPTPIDARTFERELARLAALTRTNAGGHQSPDCHNCSRCTFCTGCVDCHGCTYAQGCRGCTFLTHAEGCTDCHKGTHLVDCLRCVDSRYLEHCTDCAECTYCFGCVGLVGKEFHILNVPYDRKTWFKVVAALKAEGTSLRRR